MEKIEIENTDVARSFLNRTFFSSWQDRKYILDKKYLNYATLELQVSGNCDLNCTYCYYARFKKDLYPAKISGKTNILHNLDLVLNWLEENNMWPKFELFSGEIFSQEVGFLAFDKILDWCIKTKKEGADLVIPTNFSFIFDPERTKRVESLFVKAIENKINVYLSCSIDGKYCDAENRPFIDGKVRDDEYYDKVFEFCNKWNCNFHPMVYSNKIENWRDNWLWFQDMLKKHNMDFRRIYLLEVRNVEWTKQQLKDYYKFIRFLINWVVKHIQDNNLSNGIPVSKYVWNNKLFNAFNMFATCGRGLGCSIQSAVQLRLGDLTASLCHRAAYKQHNLWKFKVENDRIVDVEGINSNLLIAQASADHSTFPMCEACLIKHVCGYQCLGSMYEVNKDPMAPIPTVCAVEHIKVAAVYDELKALGLHEDFMATSSPEKYKTMKVYYNHFHKGEDK